MRVVGLLRSRRGAAALLAGSTALLWSGAATAQIANPPVLQDENASIAAPTLAATAPDMPVEGSKPPGRRDHQYYLNIVYTDNRLYNPSTGGYDKVRLRSYTGTGVDPERPFVSPTIEAIPGETVHIRLDNRLPAGPQPGDPGCKASGMPNKPHCFNGTNLHTHGLWVSPAGISDNVLVSIDPQTRFTYEYNIPADHPSGTFWYHTHRHGSTALQVSSGMAGALIVRGSRPPKRIDRNTIEHGDIDTLIPTAEIPERVLVMQQIQYACRGPSADPKELGPIKQDANGRYICDKDDVGGIEGYDQFGPGTWPKSGRYTSLNGEVFNPNKPLKATRGKIERWRMIHAGVRDTISLQFVKARDGKLTGGAKTLVSANDRAKFIKDSCGTVAVPYMLIAADGLTMDAAQMTTLATFQPGYRFDALVVFPTAGRYCVLDTQAPKTGVANGFETGTQLLAVVDVAPGTAGTQATQVSDVKTYIKDKLITLAAAKMPDDVKVAVIADLKGTDRTNDLKFRNFTPHADITAAEVKDNGTQELTFFINTKTSAGATFEVGNTLDPVGAKPYDPNRMDRKLPLGKAQEWTLQSYYEGHPFHIHVNPFQIVSITDPNGKEVSALGAIDDAGGTPDPQYPGLKGVWKDTLWIKSLLPDAKPGVYTIKIRTRYERYIGEFVLHCHILDHEDKGMMQNVAVVLPDQVNEVTPSGTMPMNHGH